VGIDWESEIRRGYPSLKWKHITLVYLQGRLYVLKDDSSIGIQWLCNSGSSACLMDWKTAEFCLEGFKRNPTYGSSFVEIATSIVVSNICIQDDKST
jgi:hypothetical protein